MFEFKVDRKNFKVDIDFDRLLLRAKAVSETFEEEEYMNYKTELLTNKEDFDSDINTLINYIKEIQDNTSLLELLVVKPATKRKDGWLAKGRINYIVICENVSYDSEEEFGYRVYCLKTKNISVNEIKVDLVYETMRY